MRIKEFEAKSLRDCLQQIRLDLGPEALILETRKTKTGGIMGLGARDAVRILAATGIVPEEEPARPGSVGARGHADKETPRGVRPRSSMQNGVEGVAVAVGTCGSSPRPIARSSVPTSQRPNAAMTHSDFARLERELNELRRGFEAMRRTGSESLGPGAEPTESVRETLLARLIASDVEAELAEELLERLPDLQAWGEEARAPLADSALRGLMAGCVQCAGPITVTPGGQKRVALIGPTGVGKTTTVAKLAAHYALVEKRSVGLLTVDIYRIAAVEQLRTYSQIMNIPMKVAHSQNEVAKALGELSGCELVLIDTAGRSQRNVAHLDELSGVLNTAGCETHLVLSASTKRSDLRDQVEQFGSRSVDCLLWTKLDETASYGTIYTLAARTEVPLSYLTTGQRVPEDIEVATGPRVTDLVFTSQYTSV